MRKPEGTYITVEAAELFAGGETEQRQAGMEIGRQLKGGCPALPPVSIPEKAENYSILLLTTGIISTII